MKRAALVAAAVLLVGTAAWIRAEEKKSEKKVEPRVFEMRTYYAAPGKMKALHSRFRDHTSQLFKKHGIEIIGYWSPVEPEKADEVLVYLLAYPSKAAADKSWKEFREDPDWIAAKSASEKDGTLVKKVESQFLNPTDYSPIR